MHAHVRRPARVAAARRRRRREHLGDDPGRDRRDAARRRRRSASTSRPRCPAGFWLVEARAPVGRQRPSRCTDDLTGADVHARRRRPAHAARPAPRVAAALARVAAPRRAGARPPRPRTASRSATATRPATWPTRRVPADLRHRAGERGDAERGPAVHAPSSCSTSPGAASRSRRSSCTRACRRSRRTRCRTPSATAVTDATAAHVNAAHRGRRARDRGRHHRGAGARDRRPTRRGTVHPGHGWTDLVVTPERGVRAVDGLVTGWHEPEASHLLMLEAIAGRPALERAYARGPARTATCGTSSATATCSFRHRERGGPA